MTIHFICRGNAFRSIIAEAYMNSLQLKNVKVISSGTVAMQHKATNEKGYKNTVAVLKKHGFGGFTKPHYGDQLDQGRLAGNDVTICMNQIVYDEASKIVELPPNTIVWAITDMGEPNRKPKNNDEYNLYMEEAYQEIIEKVDALVASLDLPTI